MGASQVVSLDQVRLAGALDLLVSDAGVTPRRLPEWTRHQITDLRFGLIVTMPAGVRIELETEADEVELDVMLTLLKANHQPWKPATFDLVVDGEVASSVDT